MKFILIPLFVVNLAVSSGFAHEAVGRAGLKDHFVAEIETEFYAGKGGYLHGGVGMITPVNEHQKIGIVSHFVREESGGEIFPSLGAEFIHEFHDDIELEAFAFGYFPVANQSAWALGLRGSRRIALSDGVTITPFFGPSFAQVRALDEESELPVDIGHLMLLGGMSFEAGPVEFTVFASHSFFSRDPVGLETHVDLEEMTHFAAYENNDGFAKNTVGGEFSCAVTDWLTLTGRYALIGYKDGTRHAVSIAPTVQLNEQFEVFAGVQFLRGEGTDNNLVMTGVAFSF